MSNDNPPTEDPSWRQAIAKMLMDHENEKERKKADAEAEATLDRLRRKLLDEVLFFCDLAKRCGFEATPRFIDDMTAVILDSRMSWEGQSMRSDPNSRTGDVRNGAAIVMAIELHAKELKKALAAVFLRPSTVLMLNFLGSPRFRQGIRNGAKDQVCNALEQIGWTVRFLDEMETGATALLKAPRRRGAVSKDSLYSGYARALRLAAGWSEGQWDAQVVRTFADVVLPYLDNMNHPLRPKSVEGFEKGLINRLRDPKPLE